MSRGGEFFYFTPVAAGIYTVAVTVTGNNYISGQSITKTVTTEVECYEGTMPALQGFESPLLHTGLGQYATGGSGYGWSLGSMGGYEVWRVLHQEPYQITGNPMYNWAEPGVIWIQEDRNGNNVPDEMWYELTGSDEVGPYRDMIHRRYAVTYIDSGDTEIIGVTGGKYIYWADSHGRADMLASRWPAGLDPRVTYTGTLLRDRIKNNSPGMAGGAIDLWGYVDVPDPTKHDGYDFDVFPVSRAIRADGAPVSLMAVRFIKVQTAVFSYGSVFGDMSTEIYSADYLGQQTDFPLPEDS